MSEGTKTFAFPPVNHWIIHHSVCHPRSDYTHCSPPQVKVTDIFAFCNRDWVELQIWARDKWGFALTTTHIYLNITAVFQKTCREEQCYCSGLWNIRKFSWHLKKWVLKIKIIQYYKLKVLCRRLSEWSPGRFLHHPLSLN